MVNFCYFLQVLISFGNHYGTPDFIDDFPFLPGFPYPLIKSKNFKSGYKKGASFWPKIPALSNLHPTYNPRKAFSLTTQSVVFSSLTNSGFAIKNFPRNARHALSLRR